MTFLAPAAGIIAAALAVPTLLLFYFLKLRRRQVRVSSTLLWQHAMQDLQVNTPFRWLRVSLLLVLQLLALLLLIGAVARPALTDDGPTGSRIVIVIDRSASMSAADGAPSGPGGPAAPTVTRLEEARRRGLELVDRLARRSGGFGFGGSDWQACVVELASRAVALTPFTSDAGALREAIESVRPTDQPGDLAGLLRLVDALSGASADETAPGERTSVYMLSDGSFASSGTLPLPRGVDMELVRVGPFPPAPPSSPSLRNQGIVALSARRDYDAPATVRVFARIVNAGVSAAERIVQLRIDGQVADARTLQVPGPRPDGGGAPGEASVTFEIQNIDGGVAVVTLTGSDLLASDDAAAIVLSPAGRARVLVVAPGENGADADDYLTSVLEAMELRALRTASRESYEEMMLRAENAKVVPLDGASAVPDIRDWDLIVFDRVRPASLPMLPTLSFGAGLPVPGMSVANATDESGAERPGPERVVSWRRTHPVLKYASLDQVLIDPPRVLRLPSDPGGGTAEAVAWGADGPIIGVIEGGGASPVAGDGAATSPLAAATGGFGVRRVLVAFEIARSNWGPDFSFPVFLNNSVEYLTMRGEASAGRSSTTTDPIQVRPAPRSAEVRVLGPTTLAVPVRNSTDEVVNLGQLERAGVYEIDRGSTAKEALAVNLVDATETLVRTANELPVGGAGRATGRAEQEGVREIWHWFLVAAFLLLVLEWFIAAWKMRI